MKNARTICLLTDERIAVAAYTSKRSGSPIAPITVDCKLPRSIGGGDEQKAVANGIDSVVDKLGNQNEPIVLVIPSCWCYMHVLTQQSKRTTDEALGYLFEEMLPLPIEELTCNYIPLPGKRVLAMAIETAAMRSLIDELANDQISVDKILVDVAEVSCDLTFKPIVIADVHRLRVACGLDDQSPVVLASIATGHGHDSMDKKLAQRTYVDFKSMVKLDLVGDFATAVEVIMEAAANAPDGLNLRTGSLAAPGHTSKLHRLAQHCMACSAVLLLVITIGLYVKGQQLTGQLSATNQRKQAVYATVFGTDQLPPGAAARMASERKRLTALTRTDSSDDSGTSLNNAALNTLRNIVVELPTDVRIWLQQVRIEESQVSLKGKTLRHRDAERIGESINRVPGLVGSPPRTSRLKTGGVEFTLLASIKGDE